MHPNPAFRKEPEFLHLNLIRQRGFGTLAVNATPAPLLSHIPFVLSEDNASADLHLVRSNPIARLEMPVPAVLAVLGPDGYVSPDWYEDPTQSQVPTWNYVAANLRGRLEPMPDTHLRHHLDQISATFETRLTPKKPWTADKMPSGALDRMMRMIRPFRLQIEEVEGTWKLNQNKEDAHRANAAAQIKHSAIGHETDALAHLMMGIGPVEPDF